jgi:hypothetical protein
MSILYAMRRANGDWFALDERGDFRVPVFSSSRDGMLARSRNTEMLLFQPAELDEGALGDLGRSGGDGVHYWLVENPFSALKRGRRIDHPQLVALAQEAALQARGRPLNQI